MVISTGLTLFPHVGVAGKGLNRPLASLPTLVPAVLEYMFLF